MFRLRDAQLADKALFLSVCEDVSWSKLAFELVNWIKKMVLPNVGGHHPIHWESEYNKAVEEVQIQCSFLNWDIHHLLFSGNPVPGSWVFGCRFRLSPSAPQFSGLRLGLNYTTTLPGSPADVRSWDFLVSIIMWADLYKNKSLHIPISFIQFLWRTLVQMTKESIKNIGDVVLNSIEKSWKLSFKYKNSLYYRMKYRL